jgi:hypothetical protein
LGHAGSRLRLRKAGDIVKSFVWLIIRAVRSGGDKRTERVGGHILSFDISRVVRRQSDIGPSPIPRPTARKPAPPRPRHPQNTSPQPNPPSPAPSAPSANSAPPKAPASPAVGDEMAGAADHRSIAARVTFIKKPRKSGPRNTLTLWVEICLRGLSNADLQGLKLYLLSFASDMPRNYSGS